MMALRVKETGRYGLVFGNSGFLRKNPIIVEDTSAGESVWSEDEENSLIETEHTLGKDASYT